MSKVLLTDVSQASSEEKLDSEHVDEHTDVAYRWVIVAPLTSSANTDMEINVLALLLIAE